MGNQVTTLGQIYPVEYYLADYCNEVTLESNLGSTRFMKVAKVKHKDSGYCVVKIYAINDPSIPVQEYQLRLDRIRQIIEQSNELHSLPFSQCYVNEKSIILLRQYIKYNLYDRLSTRPFLTSIEKRWIAYQLLRCIQALHSKSVYHGDIKSENVLVTSFLWITLADFAPYKPVTLPENNPSYFSYFFDTSRRHCCNIAPERFVEQSSGGQDSDNADIKSAYSSDFDDNQLTPQMDLFSLGCVLAELFSDDTPNSSIFDLGQLLMFKRNQFDPRRFIEESISDTLVRRLILNLIDLDPSKRNSANYHLDQLVPSLFPAYFKTLYDYFVKLIPQSPDVKMLMLEKDLDKLMEQIIIEDEHGLLLPLVLATSTLRSLSVTDSKLIGLKLCMKLVESSPQTMSDYTIDRLLPYIMQLISNSESRVKASCINVLNMSLKRTQFLQSSDTNVFIDYILPTLQPLAFDPSTLVRISLASNIGELAETSKRLMDGTESNEPSSRFMLLQQAFRSIVGQLLIDPNNHVRRAVLNENVSKLCEFFGQDEANDVILSHIITFLNDKSDFRLRATFFDNIDRFKDDRLIDSELIMKNINMNKRSSPSKQVDPSICVRRQDAFIRDIRDNDSRLSMSSAVLLNRITRPRGILLAHLHEHKGSVNKLTVVPGTNYFISSSNDATIKFWDCSGVSTKPSVMFRSKQTFVSPDAGGVLTASICAGPETLLALTNDNNLHLVQLYSPSSHSRLLKSINFKRDLATPELVTDLVSLSPFTYATSSTSSNLRGYDLRLPSTSDVWNLKVNGKDGLITCLDGNEFCVACGTSSSVISIFDLRFYIRATTMSYPPFQDKMRKRIRRLLLCDNEIYCSVDGNNEVSTWDCESASRTKTLWASPVPCLSSTHSSHHSVLSMIVDTNQGSSSVITAGDDMKIRFWDLVNPHRSYVVSKPPFNSHHKLTAAHNQQIPSGVRQTDSTQVTRVSNSYYQFKLVDAIQVIQETDKLPADSVASPNAMKQNPQAPTSAQNPSNMDATTGSVMEHSTSSSEHFSTAHHDSISSLATINQMNLLLSASRDGVIKIWR